MVKTDGCGRSGGGEMAVEKEEKQEELQLLFVACPVLSRRRCWVVRWKERGRESKRLVVKENKEVAAIV